MRRKHIIIVPLIFVLFAVFAPEAEAGRATAPYVEGELLLSLQLGGSVSAKPVLYGQKCQLSSLQSRGVSASEAVSLLQAAGAVNLTSVVRLPQSAGNSAYSGGPTNDVYKVRFNKKTPIFKDRESLLSFCAQLSETPGVAYAEPNYLGSLCTVPNDPYYMVSQESTYSAHGLETAWSVETGSAEMVIAVIDSGIDLDHVDLAGNLCENSAEAGGSPSVDDDGNGYVDDVYGWNFVDNNGDVEDSGDHGTRVAGIIAACGNNSVGMSGVCWQADLLPIKVASATGGITVDRVAAALRYAVNRGAKVINLSLVFSGDSTTLKAACNSAALSAVVVAAAGNDGQNFVPMYPAGYDSVAGVAALDASGERASFSNSNNPGINEWVDFAAPGVDMFSAIPADMYNREQGRGTSLAAPFVSGIAALLRAEYPQQSPGAIRNHLEQAASPRNSIVTHGIIDASAALSTAMEPDLRISNIIITDASPSDSDQALDPGETAAVQIEFENLGADILEPKLVTLTSQNLSKITVNDSTSILPILQSGKTSRKYLEAFEVQAVTPTAQVDVPMELDVSGIDTLSFDLRIENEQPIPQMIASDLILGATATWIVSGITSVTPSATLTVQPGTTVKFEEDARLEIFGTLSSVGTTANPIKWMHKTPPPQSLFAPSFEFPVGDYPDCVALGDVSGDGISDIVTAHYVSDDISILVSDGAGGFAPEVRIVVGDRPYGVALGDVTGDGYPDIVTANHNSSDVSVLAGDGAGGFASQVCFAVGSGPWGVALGDVTGDGLPDIVVANSNYYGNGNDVSVLAGDGAGGFAPQVRYDVGDEPAGLALGDVTGDGLPDIVTANSHWVDWEDTSDISVLAADGAGGFISDVTYAVGDRPYCVALGDVTADGIPDIVTANWSGYNVSILAGDGAGGFAPEVRLAIGTGPRWLALGDVTDDGITDIVTANTNRDEVSILAGDGAGGFAAQLSFDVGGYQPRYVALGDVTGDGIPDIVTANSGSDDVSILAGAGVRAFIPETAYGVGTGPRGVALGDVTGDGFRDIVTANLDSDDVSVLAGDGDGGFASQVRYAVGDSPYSVALGDITGDGNPDIVTANYHTDDVSVLSGNGAGGFSPVANYAVGHTPHSVALGDVTCDGTPDIVVGNYYGSDVSLLVGDGTGGFAPEVRYDIGTYPTVALGDVTGDGNLDIITGNESDDVSVLASDGAGGFLPEVRYAAGDCCHGVVTGDLTGDGISDIVTANSHSNDVSVLVSDGAGGFAAQLRFAAGNSPTDVALGDLTGDGNLDIVTANSWGAAVSLLVGDGTGGFAPLVLYNVGDYPLSVALGDVTGDGHLSIAAANYRSNDVSFLAGDGAGGLGFLPNIVAKQGSQVSVEYSQFSLPGPFLASGNGTIKESLFKDTGGSGLAVLGNVSVQDSTAENCMTGFAISATAPMPFGLNVLDNRLVGLIAHDATNIRVINSKQQGVISFGSLSGVIADLNRGVGVFALDTITHSISTRSSQNGIQARVVENSFAGSNLGTGIIASERISGCTAIANATGVQAPLVEDTFIIDSYGEGLVSVTDAIRLEMQQNYSISSDEVRFATSILANNEDQVVIDTVSDMYIAGNEGGGVDGIPVVDSTIIGNNGAGVANNLSVNSSNVAFNKGYGVVGGTVDGSFLMGNELGDISMATETNPQISPVTAAPAFLYEVTPGRYTKLGPGIHTFTLKFSKPMNTGMVPTLTHGQSPPYTSKVFQNASWINSQELQAKTYIDFNSGNGEHHLRVMGAMASDGFEIPPDTYHSFQVDIEGGKVISNGWIVAKYPESLLMQWNPAQDVDLAGYDIVRSQDSDNNYALVDSVVAPATQYLDAELVTDVTYYYQVWEYDTNFSRNGLTSPFAGIPGATEVMPTPTPTITSTPTSTATPTSSPTPTPTVNPSLIWVDFNYSGTEVGTESAPFNSLAEGVNAVIPGGTIRIKAGVTGEVLEITKEVRLEAPEGEARIGVD